MKWFSISTGLVLALAVAALAVGLSISTQVPSWASSQTNLRGTAPRAGSHAGGLRQGLAGMTRVDVSELPDARLSARVGPTFRSPLPLFGAPAAGPSAVPAAGGAATAASVSASLDLLSGFEGLDNGDNPDLGAPPDPQLAVGPNHVVEMVNISARIFNKSGAVLDTFALRDFFGIPDEFVIESDPKIIYDSSSGRFFAAYIATALLETRVYLAVSESSDPSGTWCFGYLSGSGLLPVADYPGIGVTNDKLTVSVNYFVLLGLIFAGEQTAVIQKSDMLSCASDVGVNVFDVREPPWFTTRPAHTLSPGADQYLAEFDAVSGEELCIDRITGTPDAADVSRTTSCIAVGTQAVPPDAPQLGGPELIHTGDNRALEAIWRDGRLWVSATGACTFDDVTFVSCLHLVEANTADMTVTQEILAGDPNEYWYYPAIRTDGDGNLAVVFSYSSPSQHPSAAVAGRLFGDPPNTLGPRLDLKVGESYYDLLEPSPDRWGDYMGAAVDPADTSLLWVVGEYSVSDTEVGWGTWIGQLRFTGAPTDTPTPTPSSSPTPSPTPTGGATPTPTPSGSPAPTSTGTPPGDSRLWGDFDCMNGITIGDAQKIARDLIDIAITQGPGCPGPGEDVMVNGALRSWGDLDCGNTVTIGDAQKTARNLIDLEIAQAQGCPEPGETILVQ